ncbi:MAG: transporter substrate-binding domain-containing protein [Gammaproteobacteria bacterium]|nr:transporter substrate-binding domain-containing protein [Gammaproteobacteria bacterium]MBQ0841163.1 transporter substrate-binding domain-containing protein [Gammaproteobacteria bacterium]
MALFLKGVLKYTSCFLLFINTLPGTALAESELTLVTGDMTVGLYHSPEQTGLVDELLGVALQRIGYTLKVITVPTERSLKMSSSGVVDGELMRTPFIEKQFPTLLRVPEPLVESEFVVFSRQAIDLTEGWQSLAGKSVGVVIGMKIIEASIPDKALVTRVKSEEQLFSLLFKKRIDMAVFLRDMGQYYLNKHNAEGIVISETLETMPGYAYLHPKHAALVPLLASSLKKMKEDGSYQVIFSQHIAGNAAEPVDGQE